MTLALLIDTAFEACQVALAQEQKIIAQDIRHGGGGQDRILAGMVRDLLQQQKTDIKNLGSIAVTTGPGRFTGLRVGIAFARGLALPYATPLIGLNTADLFAEDLRVLARDTTTLAVLLSVKRGESFVRFATPNVPAIERVEDESLISRLTQNGPATVGGFISADTKELLSGQVTFIEGLNAPTLETMATFAARSQPLPLSAIQPYYGAA